MIRNFANRVSNYLVNYFAVSQQLVPQPEAEADIRDGVSFRGTNIIILVLAILIASLGLNTNSTAVIIGAMLISPLMGPIIGIGLGVGIHDFDLIKRAMRNLIMAAGFSVVASTLYFLISPVNEGHSELLARTSPTIYDVLIGFVGGGAGIVAIGSRNKGNVIPGVAIATALMPPLCTAGYGLATWQLNYFCGVPVSHQFDIHSVRHIHRCEDTWIQGGERGGQRAGKACAAHSVCACRADYATECMAYVQYAQAKQIHDAGNCLCGPRMPLSRHSGTLG